MKGQCKCGPRKELSPRKKLWRPILKVGALFGIALFVATFAITNPNDAIRSKRQFRSWYGQFHVAFETILQKKCTSEYDIYLYGTRQNITEDNVVGTGYLTVFVQPLVNCMLINSSEYIKYAIGSAQVILGLTPTLIALLGCSSEELCLLALVGRRRLLALMLAVGSPSIYINRAFEYRNPNNILKERLEMHHVHSSLESPSRRWIIATEYFLAVLSITNIAVMAWELGVNTINGVNPNTTLMPVLWSILAIPIHFAGAVVFSLIAVRVDLGEKPPPNAGPRKPTWLSMKDWVIEWYDWTLNLVFHPGSTLFAWSKVWVIMFQKEFWPDQKPGLPRERYYIYWYEESRLFVILAWFLSVCVVLHIIFGTLIMSSITFIGPRDALGVMARYVTSVIICRVILVYELAVVRACYEDGPPSEEGQSTPTENTHGLAISRVRSMEKSPTAQEHDQIYPSSPETISSSIRGRPTPLTLMV